MRARSLGKSLPLGLFFALGLGCGDDDGEEVVTGTTGEVTTGPPATTTTTGVEETGTETTGVEAKAQLRAIHASPDAPAVDIYIAGDDTPVITDLAYGETSEFLEVDAGDYAFDIRPAGEPASSSPIFTTDTLTLGEGAIVSAVAAGLVESEDPESSFRVLAFEEGFQDPGAGNATIRVIHAGADAPAVGIDVGNDGSVELSGLQRFTATDPAGAALPAGEELQVGIVANGEPVTAFTTPMLPEGGELLVIATGLLEDLPRENTGFSLLPVSPQGSIDFIRQNPRVYALHGSPDAPAVDVCSADQLLIDGLSFEVDDSLGAVQVPPGEYPLNLQAHPDDCAGAGILPEDIVTPMLEPGEQYLVVVGGELDIMGAEDGGFEEPLLIVLTQEAFSLDFPTEAVVRAIHAASAPTVLVGLLMDSVIREEDVLIPSISPGEESDELGPLAAGVYSVALSVGEMAPFTPVAVGDIPVAGGERAWVVVVGDADMLGTDTPEALRYRIVDTGVHPAPWRVLDLPLSAP